MPQGHLTDRRDRTRSPSEPERRGPRPVWRRYWRLTRDPFLDGRTAYVPIPAHEEAVARLVDAIEAGERLAMLRAAAGLGKSIVLDRALAETRSPARRIARL